MDRDSADKLDEIAVASSYAHWIAHREAISLSTNFGALTLPFQSWRNFKEAFAPELVAQAISETEIALGRPVEHVIDPFGGSGTTALTSQFLGKAVSTIEVNPYLADLIEAKLSSYDFDELSRAYLEVLASLDSAQSVELSLPPSFVAPGIRGRYLFHTGVAERITAILAAISAHDLAPSIKRLFRVIMISCSVDLSNAVISGKGRRYRSGWEQRSVSAGDADKAFRARMSRVLYDIRRFGRRPSGQYNLIRGDSRVAVQQLPGADIAIFSPPYPNSFDYTDVYNIELWIGGYLKSADDNRALRGSTLRSHVQIKRSYASNNDDSSTLTATISSLNGVISQLWSSSIPSMVGAYFDDMQRIVRSLRDKLVPGGRIYMVVGDSKYAGVAVPVARILCELAERDGLTLIDASPFRSMRSSPQQGGQAELAETLIVLEAPGDATRMGRTAAVLDSLDAL